MKILNHPNFSLFCFFLNLWFCFGAIYAGNYLFALIGAVCMFICGRSYLIGISNENR